MINLAFGVPYKNQLFFQDSVTQFSTLIVNVHHTIWFFATAIAIFVGYMLYFIIIEYRILDIVSINLNIYNEKNQNVVAKNSFWNIFYKYKDKFESKWIYPKYEIERSMKFNHGDLIEFLWLISPCIILILIGIPSFCILLSLKVEYIHFADIKIIGNQWYWSYEDSSLTHYRLPIIAHEDIFTFVNLNSSRSFDNISWLFRDSGIINFKINILESDSSDRFNPLYIFDSNWDTNKKVTKFYIDFRTFNMSCKKSNFYILLDVQKNSDFPRIIISGRWIHQYHKFTQSNWKHYLYYTEFSDPLYDYEVTFEILKNISQLDLIEATKRVKLLNSSVLKDYKQSSFLWANYIWRGMDYFRFSPHILVKELPSFDSYLVPTSDLDLGGYRLLEVDYPLDVKSNFMYRCVVTSNDVLHSWAVPSLGIKMDAVPGRLNQFYLYIVKPGIYYGQCSELCGVNHGFMPIAVRAETWNGKIV